MTFLRSYSNYLTPRTGIFSTDTLAAVATYLRNLILNLSIVLLCLTVALLLPRLIRVGRAGLQAWPNVLLACRRARARRSPCSSSISISPASFRTARPIATRCLWARSGRRRGTPPALRWSPGSCVPLMLAALALSFWLAGPAPPLRQVLLETDWPTLRRDVWIVAAHDLHDRLLLVLRAEDRARVARAGRSADVAMAAGRARDRRADRSGRAGRVPGDHVRQDRPGVFSPVVGDRVRASGTARRVRAGRRVRDRRERAPVRGGQPGVVEPPGGCPVRCRRRLAGRRGSRGVRAPLGHEGDPPRPGPERRLARDHHRRRARRHERVHRQAGVRQLARSARDDHALRLPGRAPDRPRLRHSCRPGRVARREHVHLRGERLLQRHLEVAHRGGPRGAVPVQRGPRRVLLLADRRERVRLPHVLP